MSRVRSDYGSLPTIVLTGFGNVDVAVETVHKFGAFWFLEKPVSSESLRVLLDRAGEQANPEGRQSGAGLKASNPQQRGALGDLVGQSPVMQSLFSLIRRVAPTNACVMITGESGSGKELVARAIHSHSPRAQRPFLALNCAALPETLMESEMFGHEKGSFTGAVDRKAGALELAEGGTLFLDEIGEMPLAMQVKSAARAGRFPVPADRRQIGIAGRREAALGDQPSPGCRDPRGQSCAKISTTG